MKKFLVLLLFLFTTLVTIVVAQPKTLSWSFPVNRTHAGILLGNGVQGLMVWGDTTLNITVGRAGFWDHRGGNDFASRTNFIEVKNLVQQKNEDSLRKLFTYVPPAGEPARPQHLSAGVWQLRLPKNYRLQKGVLNLSNGTITVSVLTPAKKIISLAIKQSVYHEIAWVDLPVELYGKLQSNLIPMWQYNSEKLQSINVTVPQVWKQNAINGFTQELPKDFPLSMAQQVTAKRLLMATHVGLQSKSDVVHLLQTSVVASLEKEATNWWKQYWTTAASVTIPDPVLQEAVDYGLYKQACSTPPQGIACTLQGAFMEEYQLPPWSNDYHFNINAQMIYTPALASNRTDHFKPLLQLIDLLMPQFRRNGQLFFKNANAIMIPHAVDDRGQAIGNYWGGTIDHATTAWVAFLTWQYYQYSGDTTFLRRVTYPLLTGAFEGFWSMMEKSDSNGKINYNLPISVSPEYGSGLEGVGKNASFQLAAVHRILKILPNASYLLQQPLDNRWADVDEQLPPYAIVTTPYGESSKNNHPRIGLLEGKDIEISHRHHSHLAGIYPFQTIDFNNSAQYKLVEKSYWRWVQGGAGGWTGWCIPWASIIHNRMGNTEAAVSWLHYWRQNFVNEGRGTLHNTTNLGMAIMNEPRWVKEIGAGKRNTEIMQLDAGFGALSAIFDLLVQETDHGIYILPNRHWQWKNVSFDRIRTAGGFIISAAVKDDAIKTITVKSERGGEIMLHHNLGNTYLLNGKLAQGATLKKICSPGEVLILQPLK